MPHVVRFKSRGRFRKPTSARLALSLCLYPLSGAAVPPVADIGWPWPPDEAGDSDMMRSQPLTSVCCWEMLDGSDVIIAKD